MPHLGDKRVYSLECSGRVVIDRNCNLSTIGGHFDRSLEVDVGGSVIMTATTIDFRNTTIDFDGATLNNFTGDISGNISGTINVDVVNALEVNAIQRIKGNLEGNVLGGFIEGTVSGTFCGPVTTNSITLKDAAFITITGPTRFNGSVNLLTNNLNTSGVITSTHPTGGFVGKLTGNTTGTHFGNVQTGTISSLIPSNPIKVTSNVTITNPTKFFNGNLCGTVYTDLIQPKSLDGNIKIMGNIEATKMTADTFCGNLIGNVYGNLIISNVAGNFTGTFYGDVVGGNISGNIFADELTAATFTIAELNTTEVIASNVCGNIITDKISAKTLSYIDVTDDLIVRGNINVTEIGKEVRGLKYVVYDSIKQNGSVPLNIVNGINSTGTNTSTISAQLVISSGGLSITSGGLTVTAGGATIGGGITVSSGAVNVTSGAVNALVGGFNGSLTGSSVTIDDIFTTGSQVDVNTNLVVTGTLSVDNIQVQGDPDVKVLSPMSVQSTLGVTGLCTCSAGLTVTGGPVMMSGGAVTMSGPGVITMSGGAVTVNNGDFTVSGASNDININGGSLVMTTGDITVGGGGDLNFSTTGSVIRIGGIPVLKSQELAVGDASVINMGTGTGTVDRDDLNTSLQSLRDQLNLLLLRLRNHGLIDT